MNPPRRYSLLPSYQLRITLVLPFLSQTIWTRISPDGLHPSRQIFRYNDITLVGNNRHLLIHFGLLTSEFDGFWSADVTFKSKFSKKCMLNVCSLTKDSAFLKLAAAFVSQCKNKSVSLWNFSSKKLIFSCLLPSIAARNEGTNPKFSLLDPNFV